MTQHTASADLKVSADTVFEYLAEVENLPRYLPRLVAAHATSGDDVEVQAMVDTDGTGRVHQVGGHAWLHSDDTTKVLEWGAEGPHDYHGRLSVEGDHNGSTVTVMVDTRRAGDDDVDEALERTVQTIKEIVESGSVA